MIDARSPTENRIQNRVSARPGPPDPVRWSASFRWPMAPAVAGVLLLWSFLAWAGPCSAKDDPPSVVLISVDGLRWDFPARFDAPAMQAMIDRGFQAERLVPVFPTVTFPNHYSIATGLYPDRHGLVGNEFYDPDMARWYALRDRAAVSDGRFYGGEPIWLTAEKRGMPSAAFYFVGTEADIQGRRPTHWRPYDKSVPAAERVDQVLAWLEMPAEQRPRLITLYFEDVDSRAHWRGIDSEELDAAMARVDDALARLVAGIDRLAGQVAVNVIVVSDHGAAGYDDGVPPLVLEQHIDLDGIRNVGEGAFSFLYFEESAKNRIDRVHGLLSRIWRHGEVYRPAEAPQSWRVGDNPRWPDLILMPAPGHGVLSRADQAHRMNPGDHGWAPEAPDMHGVLFGFGPGFRPGSRVPAVRAVDIYPLMTHLLGITDGPEVDGSIKPLLPALSEPPPEPVSPAATTP